MPSKTRYSVQRLRLINFHNFVDETIDIGNGGHLFLLGDNGSGKTTILDALHMVLAGNESVEFNAAARVAGSARHGRRPIGIVVRQNVEKAEPLNPNGGITYAAVELQSQDGHPLCLVVGMSARSPEDNVQYWGAVKSGVLENLPLLRDTLEGSVPSNRREFRAQLQDENAFCGDQSTYRKKLSSRLYGGKGDNDTLFRETCRLLRMGKAYREIAAGTSDYHELFKKLLPEPRRELFNEVVQTLTELERSNSELAGLEEKQRYLESLEKLVEKIRRHRETALRYQWLTHHLILKRLDNQLVSNGSDQDQARVDLDTSHNSIAEFRREKEAVQQALNVLQQKDRGGLLTRRGERKQEQSRLENEVKQQTEVVGQRVKQNTEVERQSRAAEQGWRTSLKHAYDQLNRLNKKLPFSLLPLLTLLDEQTRLESPVGAIIPDTNDVEQETATVQQAVITGQASLSQKIAERQGARDELDNEIQQLKSRQDLIPSIPHYVDALRLLEREMIRATPLYQSLEWKPGLTDSEQKAIEEAIGADVLATIIVSEDEHDVALKAILPEFPGIRIATGDVPEQSTPGWIRETFDLQRCEPDAVRVLIEEMQAGRHPATERRDDWTLLRFRAHERRLRGDAQGLIGSEQRKKALKRKIQESEQRQKQLSGEIRELEKQQKENEQQLENLETLQSQLRSLPRDLGNQIHVAQTARAQLDMAKERLADQRAIQHEAERYLQEVNAQLADLQAQIDQEGLDRLEQKQRALERKLNTVEDQLEQFNQKIGGINNQLTQLAEQANTLQSYRAKEAEALSRLTAELLPLAEEVESVEYWVLKTNRGQQFTRVENVEQESARNEHERIEAVTMLREKLNDPSHGAVYAFTYNDTANILLDRHSSSVVDVVQAGQREIEEQRQLINEKTQKLIRDLIMGELFTELKRSISDLKTMVRKINGLLGGRVFGSTRYKFNLPEVPHYRDLLNAIQKFHPFRPEAQQELEQFLELHKDEIMNTEVNDIPDALDYRNWFHYELTVQSMDEHGDIVMDRKTKSLGSGGEQAVPNYLLILTVAHLLYEGNDPLRLHVLLFDEAFYGIDAGRRDQLLGFASDLGLQLFIASPDLDGVKQEIPYSTTLLVFKDDNCDVHLFSADFKNPLQTSLLDESQETVILKPLTDKEDE